jgi:hypothetical protein
MLLPLKGGQCDYRWKLLCGRKPRVAEGLEAALARKERSQKLKLLLLSEAAAKCR